MGRRRSRNKRQEGTFTTKITKLSHEGRGISKINDKIAFITFGLPDETVEFKYTNSRSKFDEGIVLNVIEKSENRIDAKCEYYELCGGCALQHLSTEQQIKHKQKTLVEQFEHFGELKIENYLPALLSPEQWGYRLKARLGVRYVDKKEEVMVGFRERNGRFITNMNSCEVIDKKVSNLIPALKVLIKTMDCYKTLPQIEVAVDDEKVALIFRHLEDLSKGDIDKFIKFGAENEIWIYLQPKGPDTIHLIQPIVSNPHLHYTLPEYDIKMEFKPNHFTQVNQSLNKKMLALAIEHLDIQDTDMVLDLFCGLGNFSLPIARFAMKVVGVEGDESMTIKASENALLNGISNTEFFVTNLFESIDKEPWIKYKYNKLLLDPARAGALEICENISKINPEKIVYISCNPATLARDSKALVNNGYKILTAGIMDMFPHTAHVESIAVFEKIIRC